jgi:hypothetical protein
VTSFGLLIFENDVDVPLKSTVISRKLFFYSFFVDILKVNDENSRIRGFASGSIRQTHGSTVPDTDPDHIKMSWIRNTAKNYSENFILKKGRIIREISYLSI